MEFLIRNSSIIQSILTVLGSLGVMVFVWKSRPGLPRRKWPNTMFRFLALGLLCIFLALATYQARWQLFGFFSSEFLRVQRGFDPRDDILGTRFHRGEILDWKHRPLARDVKEDKRLIRDYPLGAAAVHTVGYTHPVYGLSGLEKRLDSILMGRTIQTPSDALRLTANIFTHRTLRGNPLVLTLDRELQQAAWDALRGYSGAIVALDPRNGAIRAMVSRPGYHPETLNATTWDRLLNRTDSPFLNRACQGLYPPGSTFKPLVALAALDAGRNPVFNCTRAGFNCGPADPVVRDYDHYHKKAFQGHGSINMSEALTESCNVYFAQLAADLTAETILQMARTAGLDRAPVFSGPAIPVEAGRLPKHDTWHTARTARLGIGQDDLLLTPLHMALLAGAIGNGGVIYQPRLVEGEDVVMWKRLAAKRVANRVSRMMIKVVETGTGQQAQVTGIVVGGKTGTAENSGARSHALFICFAPWPKPAIAIAVVAENAGLGGRVAAPMAAQIIQAADSQGLLEDIEVFHGTTQ